MCKISVAVPSKNVANYIGKCLESVMNQTLSDIEIICVDAFSDDGTREIIKEYQKKDSRIKLLDDDKRSSGYADNLAFSVARGEYLAIVESDDYIKPEMFERLYTLAKEYDLDYVKANFSMFIEDGDEVITIDNVQQLKNIDIYNKVINPANYPELLELDGYMWKGLYKKEYIYKNNIKLNETKGAAYQDNGFLHMTLSMADRVMYINESFYQYRRDNENSSDYNPKGLVMMYNEYCYIEEYVARNAERMQPYMNWYYYKLFHQFQGQFSKVVRNEEFTPEVEEIVNSYIQLLQKGLSSGKISQEVFGDEMRDFFLLMNSPEDYYKYFKNKILCMDKLYEMFITDIKKKDKVVLVCCGDKGKDVYNLFRRNGVRKVIAACDNQKEKHGKKFYNIVMESVENTVEKNKDAHFVIANNLYHNELKRQLLHLGVNKEQISIFNLEINAHLATSVVV